MIINIVVWHIGLDCLVYIMLKDQTTHYYLQQINHLMYASSKLMTLSTCSVLAPPMMQYVVVLVYLLLDLIKTVYN